MVPSFHRGNSSIGILPSMRYLHSQCITVFMALQWMLVKSWSPSSPIAISKGIFQSNAMIATANRKRRTTISTITSRMSSLQRQGTSYRSETFTRRFATVSPTAANNLNMNSPDTDNQQVLNLATITQDELETILVAWGHPKYRAKQVYHWIRDKGVTDVDDMLNIPKDLRQQLRDFSKRSSLTIAAEQVSKDGTIKRAYRCHDGQLIESVLMPYDDGRTTACISSQAGCAMGCVFCATGQGGLQRQLSADEIFEQVYLYHSLLQQRHDEDSPNKQGNRLSNIVFMGMGEPLANFRNVKAAIERITKELNIGARKITVSTVGVVPNIRKLMEELPPVRLAVSLHCATDKERDELIPANKRYGGLHELMTTLQHYIETTGRRLTLEWALIEQQNDTPHVARQLGRLLTEKYPLRRDMVHINVIPLNPTGGYGGGPSQRSRVNRFCEILEKEFHIACTPRVRRGIDIDAGCGQLTTRVLDESTPKRAAESDTVNPSVVEDTFVNLDDDEDWEDPVWDDEADQKEAERLMRLVKGLPSGNGL